MSGNMLAMDDSWNKMSSKNSGQEEGYFESARLYPYFRWVSLKPVTYIEQVPHPPTPGSMGEVLMNIDREDSPKEFKENVLRLAQIYFDDLFEGKLPYNDDKANISEAVLKAVRLSVTGYFDNKIPYKKVKACIMPYEKILSDCKNHYKFRHLDQRESALISFAKNMECFLKEKDVDVIIPIASGGFEPTVLCADYLSTSEIFPVRYSLISRSDKEVLLPPGYSKKDLKARLSGVNVLIVDDLIQWGRTISIVKSWLDDYRPNKVYFTVVVGNDRNLKECGLYKNPEEKYLYQSEP
jgi:adenine/guanine phosphoribosyltransferase-like PRPP-binding protein